jgi:hypothetical protein
MGILSGKQGAPGGGADRIGGLAVQERGRFGKTVHMRGGNLGIPGKSCVIRPLLIGH